MRTIHPIIVLCLTLTLLASGRPAQAAPSPTVAGNNQFALEFYAKLREQDGNLFLSPFSISTALAMTYAGARGNTDAQMAKVLHFQLDQKRLHPAFAELVKKLNAPGEKRGYQLAVANALWGQKGYGFLKDFLNSSKTHYDAGLSEVDFVKAAEAARKTINTWVEKKTQDKIKNLIPPGVLKPLTRLVLTNAIYFKGDWATQFKKAQTKNMPFHLSATKKADVPMMYQKRKFRHAHPEGLQVLELPYVSEDLSMFVLLPDKVDGLPAMEKSLTIAKLDKWLSGMGKREVNVYLPKFKLTSQFSLSGTLSALGMPDAFSKAADFSGMNGKKDLYISAVIHKAFVDVNEEGTEAAAATAVVMTLKSAPARQIIFRADHPFLFLIRDNKSGSLLFLGRVANPGK